MMVWACGLSPRVFGMNPDDAITCVNKRVEMFKRSKLTKDQHNYDLPHQLL